MNRSTMGNANSNTSTGSSSNGKQRITRRASSEASKAGLTAAGSSNAGGMSRSPSGTDINEKNYTQFVPVDKLAKVIYSFYIIYKKNTRNLRLPFPFNRLLCTFG